VTLRIAVATVALALLSACVRPVAVAGPVTVSPPERASAAIAPPPGEGAPLSPAPDAREPDAPPVVAPPSPGMPPLLLSPRDRVEFHLERVRALTDHFQRWLAEPCPRFATRSEWDEFLDAEIGQAVLLAAHLREASTIARRSREEDLIRAAQAPEGRFPEARGMADKVEACARDNGATVDIMRIVRRVQRELPQRRAEIRLPR
jgi:hypothetical protein